VYYVGTSFEDMTNTAVCLGAYLMLEHGYSPMEAMKPFLRIRGCPLEGFRDATWADADFTLDAISCLEGLRKAVDQGLITDSPHDFIDEFDCDTYDEQQDPEILNVTQVILIQFPCVCVDSLPDCLTSLKRHAILHISPV
jgi:hypothetical protein